MFAQFNRIAVKSFENTWPGIKSRRAAITALCSWYVSRIGENLISRIYIYLFDPAGVVLLIHFTAINV